ncbi:hypothetical protein J5X84_35855 [Streptosporangiaceae bacterium NEAU-GS5]|nr:hypothetical protein [Streptosporangiaceae bacterium NEAU-GS5]
MKTPVMISVSVVVVLGAVVALALRYTHLRAWHAAVCVLFGFHLSQSTAAPQVRHLITTLVAAITGHA